MDENFKKLYETKPHPKPHRFGNFEKRCKIRCNVDICKYEWGITVKYQTFEDLPVIKIESFTVKNIDNDEQDFFRKWRDVNFAVKKFMPKEMCR